MSKLNQVSKIIQDTRKNNGKLLNLSYIATNSEALKVFPEEVLDLKELETLILNRQPLSRLPESIVHLKNLKRLELVNCNFETLPKSLEKLPYLRNLQISGNPMHSIPHWITERSDWTALGLGGLRLIEVPGWIQNQSRLIELDLSANQIHELNDWIGDLNLLEKLVVGGNPFKFWPNVINNLTNLQILALTATELTQVPDSISALYELKQLFLQCNKLRALPSSFADLQNLERLYLGNNYFDEIPKCIFALSSLKKLNLDNVDRISILGYSWSSLNQNTIREVPPEIIRLENLEALELYHNPIHTPPEEVVRNGIRSIREYLRQAEEQGVDQLFEAKLILVGEPGAGKTSLAHKLQNGDYELNAQEPSTQGIEISPWNFPLESGREFRVNLWDFGGQEIYHATHQYFLTKRSLYLLIADMRNEDTDYEFWLNIIELLGGDSPVLIIKNEKQDRVRELDERLLRGRFANLKEILATNLETNRGLERIQDTIRHYIRQLPHIGTPLPKSWVQVRAALESDPRNTISLDEYLLMCEQSGFHNRSDKLQLSGYLHDLGVCLHFQEDPILKNIVILKPQWGTDAAYKVLDNPTVIANLGYFTRSDLEMIWDRPEYQGMQDELLQLMMKFRLCYPIPGIIGTFMAAQLLSLKQPEYAWDNQDNLHLRFTYEFMPKGLLTQLIVALHDRIAEHNLVWRTGVVLVDPRSRARAEVVEYYSKREIRIRVEGIQKKDLLTIISYEMDKIYKSYPGLKYSTLIPCNCQICKFEASPHFYTLEILNHFSQHRQVFIQCQHSFQMVEVRGLLDDVLPTQPTAHSSNMEDAARVQFTGSINNLTIHSAEAIDNHSIRTGGGAYVGGDASIEGDFVGRDQQKFIFYQVYEIIQVSETIKTDDKPRLQETVEDIEAELQHGGEEPNEGFLTRRFKNIALMAPDILDVVLAAATNPAAGFTVAARKIAKRAAEHAKRESDQNMGNK